MMKEPIGKVMNTTRISRRHFLQTTVSTAASVAAGWTWLATGKAPAYAQKRTLTALALSLFVPPGDERFREIMEEFGKAAGVETRFDTIQVTQVPPKLAAEANAQEGHDIVDMWEAYPALHARNLEPLNDILEPLDAKFKYFTGPKETFYHNGTWLAAPWYWLSFPQNVNQTHWDKAGVQIPTTWEELRETGKKLKRRGNPIGMAISHATDANASWWAVLWCFGGKVFEEDSKTVALKSEGTEHFLDFAVRLYNDAMTSEVLTWDDAGNNRFMLSGKGSWTINPISIWFVAHRDQMPVAKELRHYPSLSGPAGHYNSTFNHCLGIWKFSKNKELAKEFLTYFFSEERYPSWIAAAQGFCMSPFEAFINHPVWTEGDPALRLLPQEGPFIRSQGWPGKPTAYVGAFNSEYILPDMIAKVINGAKPKDAIDWAAERTERIVKETKI